MPPTATVEGPAAQRAWFDASAAAMPSEAAAQRHYVARVLKDTEAERRTVAAMLDEAGHLRCYPRPYNPDADELRQIQAEARAAQRAREKKDAARRELAAFIAEANTNDVAGALALDPRIALEMEQEGVDREIKEHARATGFYLHGQFIQTGVDVRRYVRLKHRAKPRKKARRNELSLSERARKVLSCGDNAVVFKVAGDSAQHLPGRCRDRLCPSCWRIDGARLALALQTVLVDERASGGRLGMLTLTIRHQASDPLRRVARKFRRAWALLINRKFWREAVSNYFRTIEVELTPNGWHFHAHVLVSLSRAARLKKPQAKAATRVFEWRNDDIERKFQSEWETITARLGRHSHQVTWEKVHGREHKVVAELCKYVTKKWGEKGKPGQRGFFDFSPDQISELAHGIRNVKLHQHSDGWVHLIRALEQADEADFIAQQAAAGEEAARVYTWADVKFNEACRLTFFGDDRDWAQWEFDRPLILDCLKREHFKAQADMLEQGRPKGPPEAAETVWLARIFRQPNPTEFVTRLRAGLPESFFQFRATGSVYTRLGILVYEGKEVTLDNLRETLARMPDDHVQLVVDDIARILGETP